jgi:hypothetical protein
LVNSWSIESISKEGRQEEFRRIFLQSTEQSPHQHEQMNAKLFEEKARLGTAEQATVTERERSKYVNRAQFDRAQIESLSLFAPLLLSNPMCFDQSISIQ